MLCYCVKVVPGYRVGRHEVPHRARSEREWSAEHHLRLDRQQRHLVSTPRIRRRMITQLVNNFTYLLTYLLTYLFTYLLTYLFTYLFIYFIILLFYSFIHFIYYLLITLSSRDGV